MGAERERQRQERAQQQQAYKELSDELDRKKDVRKKFKTLSAKLQELIDTGERKVKKNSDLKNEVIEFLKEYSQFSPIEDKETLIKELDENNIACRPLISGSMGTQPFYKKLYGENKLPKCSIIDERGVYVPNHDKMSKEDIDRVCDILLKY
jgi:dTDP-4-amino-4,6-dideoxygalactose transaminase